MQNFHSYQLAKQLYQASKALPLKGCMRNQLLRASSSVALNLAEGNDRQTQKDRKKFFNIALTSLREVQSIIDLENLTSIHPLADQLRAMIYKLCKYRS